MQRILVLGAAVWLAGAAVAQAPVTPAKPPPGDMWLWVRMNTLALAWNLNAGKWSQDGTTVEGQWAMRYDKPVMVEGEAITWVQNKWRINCPAKTVEIIYQEELTAGMGSRFVVENSKPAPIKAGTPDDAMRQLYCDNNTFPEDMVKQADGIIEMIVALDEAAPKS